jgi:hypothetical protein
MYRKKRRNKRSDEMMHITFKIVVHALRLSGIEIRIDVSVVARKKMCMVVRKKMCMTERKNMCMKLREDARGRE